MNPRALHIIDLVLGLAIIVLLALILTTSPVEPPPIPEVATLGEVSEAVALNESEYIAQAYPQLGATDILGVPIPRPPAPKPVPEPPAPCPNLDEILSLVEIWSCFEDEGQIKINGGESIDVVKGGTVDLPDNRDRRNSVTVDIVEIDDYEFEITFRLAYTRPAYQGDDVPDELEFPEENCDQEKTLSMMPSLDEFDLPGGGK